MLYTIIVILIIIWLLGAAFNFGGVLLHLLLMIALIVFVIRLIRGEK